jgi:POTRA domain, FtsQ-type
MRRPGRRAGTGRGRRDPWKAAFFGLAAAALAAGVTWALLGSSFLVVRTVQTTGSSVPRSAVLAAADVRMGTPLIRIDTGAVARRVEGIRQVQVARVSLSWPDGLVIWTKRRTPVFALTVPGGYEVLDSYGVVLRHSTRAPRGLLPLDLASGRAGTPGPAVPLRRNPAVLAAGAVIRTLPGWLKGRVRQVRADGPADVMFVMRGGSVLRWGSQAHAAAKVAEVAVLLRTRAGYYDVSDPATAVTGTSASTPSPSASPSASRR